jgi:hypothetical protein
VTAAYLESLNPEQRRAVEHGVREQDCTPRAPLLVIAGAGSGKTNTLAHRVAHLIFNGADPRRILLMTFSRRAAAEMTRRVERIARRVMGQRADIMTDALAWAGTFHGIGARLLGSSFSTARTSRTCSRAPGERPFEGEPDYGLNFDKAEGSVNGADFPLRYVEQSVRALDSREAFLTDTEDNEVAASVRGGEVYGLDALGGTAELHAFSDHGNDLGFGSAPDASEGFGLLCLARESSCEPPSLRRLCGVPRERLEWLQGKPRINAAQFRNEGRDNLQKVSHVKLL